MSLQMSEFRMNSKVLTSLYEHEGYRNHKVLIAFVVMLNPGFKDPINHSVPCKPVKGCFKPAGVFL